RLAGCVPESFGVFCLRIGRISWKSSQRKTERKPSEIPILFAFAIGCLIGHGLCARTYDPRCYGLFLAVLAGYNLALFRYFRKTEVNNGIMTGNLKDLMSKLYEVVFDPDEKSEQNFADLFAVIVIFVAGIFTGSFLVSVNQRL